MRELQAMAALKKHDNIVDFLGILNRGRYIQKTFPSVHIKVQDTVACRHQSVFSDRVLRERQYRQTARFYGYDFKTNVHQN